MIIRNFYIIILFYTITINAVYSQYVEEDNIPQYDCNHTKWNKFESQKFIIVTPNDTDSLLNDRVEVHSSWYNDTCLIKKENELTKLDYKKHLWILGTIGDYKNWNSFRLPILKTKNGFIFNNSEFTDSLDGIGIVDTNRIAFVGNSSQTIFGLREPDLAYGYDFVITQNNKKTYFGNFENDSVHWSNIEWLKETNYIRHPYEHIDFLVSKKYEKLLNLDSINAVLQNFTVDFCKLFNLKIPKKKLLALIHQNHSEIANMTAFWEGACGGHIYGLHVWNEIHTEGFDFRLIKHEFGHHLFNGNFESHIPPIITEGVIEYYFNQIDNNAYSQNLELTKLYVDSLNLIDFITDEANFFGCGQYKGKGIGYGVSGIFVRYLIDKYGIDAFKIYCGQRNHLTSIERLFNKTSMEFVRDFIEWLNTL